MQFFLSLRSVSKDILADAADLARLSTIDSRLLSADAWIAASALYYQVPLTTNNRADYSMVQGLALLSA